MATFDSVFICESGDPTNLAVGAASSSAAQAIGKNAMVAIMATGDFHIAFGDDSGMAAASANSMRCTGDSWNRFDMGQHTHIRVYNPGGSSITVQIMRLARG